MNPYRENSVITVEECVSCQLKRMRRAERVKWLKVVAWPVTKAMFVALPWCLMWAQHWAGHGTTVEEAYAIASAMLLGAGFLGNWIRVFVSQPDAD